MAETNRELSAEQTGGHGVVAATAAGGSAGGAGDGGGGGLALSDAERAALDLELERALEADEDDCRASGGGGVDGR